MSDTQVKSAWPDASLWPDAVIQDTFVDPLGLEKFWFQWYLDGFVDQGHGKLKCLLGRPGSGKTHFLRHFGMMARQAGYQVAMVNFAEVKVAAIEDLYRAAAQQMDWDDLLSRLLLHIIATELGYPDFSGHPKEFVAWGENTRQLTPTFLRRDLREAIDRYLKRTDWHPEFRLAVRTWMQEQVGDLAPNESAVVAWLRGEKLGAAQRKSVGVRSNVTRRTARALLASLASLTHRTFGKGLLVLMDNLHAIASGTKTEGQPYYTKMARDQVYEMIRELIDESPFTPYLVTIVAGNTDPLVQVRKGIPSYPALWERLESEVQSAYVNRFADLMDLDTLWDGDEALLADLAHHWEGVKPLASPLNRPDGEPTGVLGLEWGKPRRTVMELWENSDWEGGQPTW